MDIKKSPKKVEVKKTAPKKVEVKKTAPKKKMEVKKTAPKKVEVKKTAPKKVEVKKEVPKKDIKLVKIDSKKLDTFIKSQEKKKKAVQVYKKKKIDDPSFENKEMQVQIRFRESISKQMKKEKNNLDSENTNTLFDRLVASMICIRDVLEKGPVLVNKDRKEVVTNLIKIHFIEEELKSRKVKKMYKNEQPYIKEACKQIKLFYNVLEKTETK